MEILRKAWPLIKETFSEWSNDKAPRLGAALSYYTVFSLTPLLLIVVSVAGLVLGTEAAQNAVLSQLGGLVGPDTAETIRGALVKWNEDQRAGSIVSAVIGFVTLLIGATGVMLELQGALNTVWKVVPKPGLGVLHAVRERLLSLGLILSFGFLLLVSLSVSAALGAFGGWMSGVMPGWTILARVINVAISLVVVALLFAVLFKLLPDAKVAWRDVWVGAIVTALLFQLGKVAIGLYLGRATTASAFGAAGSLAVLLVWIYYSSQILLLGAEFTRVYANHYGSTVVPSEAALPAPGEPNARRVVERELKEQTAGRDPKSSSPAKA